MAFSENVKQQALQMAGYTCCICRRFDVTISIEVHHIIPQNDKGPDTIENAIALCPNHHEDLGANREKRKKLKEVRDYWYQVIKNKYGQKESELLSKISKDVSEIKENLNLSNLKKDLTEFTKMSIQKITAENAPDTVSSIVGSLTANYSVRDTVRCSNCGRSFFIASEDSIDLNSLPDFAFGPVLAGRRHVYCTYCGTIN